LGSKIQHSVLVVWINATKRSTDGCVTRIKFITRPYDGVYTSASCTRTEKATVHSTKKKTYSSL